MTNGREHLFFKNVELHKSMSYKIKEDKEQVDKMREKYRIELMKQQEEKAKRLKKHNSFRNILLRWLFGIHLG